jgi:hypothetical protein
MQNKLAYWLYGLTIGRVSMCCTGLLVVVLLKRAEVG